MKPLFRVYLLAQLALVVIFAGCNKIPVSVPADILGSWTLHSLNDSFVSGSVQPYTVTIVFRKGFLSRNTVEGQEGRYSYSGIYRVLENNQIHVDQIRTNHFSLDLILTEERYFKVLKNLGSYQLIGQELILTSADRSGNLVFTRQ